MTLRTLVGVVAVGAVLAQGADGRTMSAAELFQDGVVFGPATVIRAAGRPSATGYTFTVPPGLQPPFRIVAVNGNHEGRLRTSSASVSLNGVSVLGPSDFSQNVGDVTRQVQLLQTNTLSVQLQGEPGAFLMISVVGQMVPDQTIGTALALVGADGGSVTLEGVAVVTLAGADLRPDLTMQVDAIVSPSKLALYQSETTGAGPALSRLVRITSTENINEPVAAAVRIPPWFVASLGPGLSLELFAEFRHMGASGELLTSYERLGALYDPATGFAHVSIPPSAFTPTNSVTTSIIVGSYLNAPISRVTGDNIVPSGDLLVPSNEVIALSADLSLSIPAQVGNPLHAALVVNSGFGPRSDPNTGQPSFHPAVDLDTSSQPVFPVLPGIVEASGPQNPCTLVNGVCKTGYGHRVRVNHGSGLTSVYAHLQPSGLPAVGAHVTSSTQIGTSDTTGNATGDHLHLEYRIDGHAVDPMLFVDQRDIDSYLGQLSVVALVNGQPVESSRRMVVGAQAGSLFATFAYRASLDLGTLGLAVGSTNQLAIVVQDARGASSEVSRVSVVIQAPRPLVTAVDDFYSMTQGSILTVPAPGVLANDTYPPGATIRFVEPPRGLTNVAPHDGGFILDMSWSPFFIGPLSLQYMIHSTSGDSNVASVIVQVTPAPPALLQISGGNNQVGAPMAILPNAVSVLATDQFGNPAGHVPATFRVTSGGGCVSGSPTGTNCQSELATLTNGTSGPLPGMAGVFWKLGALVGTQTIEVIALGGSAVTFTATASATGPAPTPFTVSASGLPEAIPNPGSVTRRLLVPTEGTIKSITLFFAFPTQCERNHYATLTDPGGRTVVVMNRGGQRCSGVLEPYSSNNVGIAGLFDGRRADGEWVFTIHDLDADAYSGTLREVTLTGSILVP